MQLKLDRLDEAFLFSKSIDQGTYERHRDKLRQELTFNQIDVHADQLEKMDVEGILAFAERILPRAADLWAQSSLDHKQRLQTLFFPEGISFDGSRFNRTAVTAPFFSYLAEKNIGSEGLVSPEGIDLVQSSAKREDARLIPPGEP